MLTRIVDAVINLPPDLLSQWGYILIAFFAIIESLPMVGLVIPGGVMVIAAGFFVKVGILKFFPITITIAVSVFIGDVFAYYLGRYFGYEFLIKIGKYIFFKPVHFEKAKKLLLAHPRKAILGGRLHAITRCVMPFAAGAADVKPGLFVLFAAFSAVVWTLFNIAVGYVFGSGFQVASEYLGEIFFVALVLSILVIYSYQFISRFTERNKHLIQRYQIYPLVLNLISIYVVAKIAESVRVGSRIHCLDELVNNFFQQLHTPYLTKFFIFITSIATPTKLTIAGIILAAFFIYKKRWYFVSLLPASLLAGAISGAVLKKMLHIERPFSQMIQIFDFSFPSGHATISVIFFGLLTYFFYGSIKNKIWRGIYIGVCLFAAFLVCISRLYLNVHWVSDVTAGIALGIFWVTFFIILFRFFTSLSSRLVEKEFDNEIKELE